MPEVLKSIATHHELTSVRKQVSSAFKLASSLTDGIVLKGFVSTDMPDRDQELFDPYEFDIEGYMAAPALLCNHALWETSEGVKGNIGRTLSLTVARLKRGPTKDTFSVWDEIGKKEIDVIHASDFPRLSIGTKGLYAFVKVTEPSVIKMIERGELSAFSWRGAGSWGYALDGKTSVAYKTLKGIDLWEISLVSVPNNPGSYAVMKSAVVGVQALAQGDGLSQFLTRTGLDHCSVIDISAADFNSSLEVVKMLPGLTLLAEPLKKGVPFSANPSQLGRCGMPATENTESVKTAPAAGAAEAPEKVTTTEAPTEAAKTAPEVDQNVVNAVAEVLSVKFTPLFESLIETSKSNSELTKALAEKVSQLTMPAAPAEKAPETPAAPTPPAESPEVVKMKKLVDDLGEVKKSISDMAKVIGGITPAAPIRAESVKSAPEDEDPNAVFDSVFFGKSMPR